MMSKHIAYLYKRIDGEETVEIDWTKEENSPVLAGERSETLINKS